VPKLWVYPLRLGLRWPAPAWPGSDICPGGTSPDGHHWWVVRVEYGLPDRCRHCALESSPSEWEHAQRRWFHGPAEYLLRFPIAIGLAFITPFLFFGQLIGAIVVGAVTGRGEEWAEEELARRKVPYVWMALGVLIWIAIGAYLIAD